MPPTTPPRPRCAFRVAAVGHRWDQLGREHAHGLRAQIHRVLTSVEQVATQVSADPGLGFAATAPRLTLYSGLAEGTDRIAAEAARQLDNWRLHAVAPFALHYYEQDCGDDRSLTEFRHLWVTADARTVLDGSAGEFDAYAPLADVLVDFCDLLVVAWNGQRGRGPGGTADCVERARRADVPIVRIDPSHTRTCWLEDLSAPDDGRSRGLADLDARIHALLVGANAANERALAAAYFAERIPTRPLPGAFQRIVGFFQPRSEGDHIWAANRAESDPGKSTREAWAARWTAIRPPFSDEVLERFAEAHGWADQLATVYAARFRQTFTAVFLLAPIAVVAAYLGAVGVDHSIVRISIVGAIEVAILVYVSLLVRRGRRDRLRERWLDYRALAERIRHLAVLWPMLRSTPMVRMPPLELRHDPRLNWVGWLLRSVARDAGLAEVECTPAYAAACRDLLCEAEIVPQRAFHQRTLTRATRVQRGLSRLAERFFLAALFFALLHLVIGVLAPEWEGENTWHHEVEILLAGLCVGLPAFAASIHGFLGLGDFAGVAVRSGGIGPRLSQIAERLAQLDPVDVAGVGKLAVEATTLMETELATWRTVAETRELETP